MRIKGSEADSADGSRWRVRPRARLWTGPLVGLLVAGGCMWVGAGCTTKAKARLQAEKAYQAGLQQAAPAPPVQPSGVTVVGPVRHRFVPWREGLTLQEAIYEAVYTGFRDPRLIRLIRGAEWVDIHPNDLLRGTVNPEVEPGDVIELR